MATPYSRHVNSQKRARTVSGAGSAFSRLNALPQEFSEFLVEVLHLLDGWFLVAASVHATKQDVVNHAAALHLAAETLYKMHQ